ncbi:MAG: aminoacyl-histidine dipeptidase [Bacteroidales bacterium]
MQTLSQLKPEVIWKHFEELCKIPRPSKHEKGVIEYLKDFAIRRGLSYKIDRVGNVLISKPATRGREGHPTVVLQSHVDMVPQKNSDVVHDFYKDPIRPYIDGEWVKAQGTTLGADNGIGVSCALAVLESENIQHGPIEALFTVDEETGMTGAFNLTEDFVSGKILLNLDSEDYGELFIGCAGGINTIATFEYKPEPIEPDHIAYQLRLVGLKGGHSGADIHLGRGNANKLINRFLWNAEHFFGLRLCSIQGGNMRNAIPREAFAMVTIPSAFEEEFLKSVATFEQTYREELKGVEENISFTAVRAEKPAFCIDKATTGNLLDALYAIPNGVIRMIPEMPHVVETSTNLAIVQSNEQNHTIEVISLLRSSVDSAKFDLCNMIESIFDMAQAKTRHEGDYPGWKPDFNSPLLGIMKNVYKNIHGEEPQVKVIHAGLECGIIGSIYPGMQMVSFGPTIQFPHSPDERVNIKSVEMFWNYLTRVLEAL